MNKQRYDKLNALIHLQNQKSHYKRIMEAKKNISFDHPEVSKKPHLRFDTKLEKSRERERKQSNRKLVERLKQINEKNGILQSMDIAARRHKISMKTNTSFHYREQQTEIDKNNVKIVERLNNAKPMIGTKSEWKVHYQSYKNWRKKLRKHSRAKDYDPEKYLHETLGSLNRGDRSTLDRFSSYSKRGEERSEVISRGSNIKKVKENCSNNENMKQCLSNPNLSNLESEKFKQKIDKILRSDEEDQE